MPIITSLSELTIDGKLSLGDHGSSKDLFEFYGEELRTWFHARHAVTGNLSLLRSDPAETPQRRGFPPLKPSFGSVSGRLFRAQFAPKTGPVIFILLLIWIFGGRL